ncbi:MAG: TolC family protein [Pseudomonadales bacterium]
MLRYFFNRCIVVGGCALYCSSVLYADPSALAWSLWLHNQLEQHPDMIAAQQTMNAAFSIAEGRDQPLYNPALETEYEQQDDVDNYRLGISQTIDLWDKRGTRMQQGLFSRTAAKQNFQIIKQRKIAQALNAIVVWQATRQRADLARRQEQQLKTLLELVKGRQQAGDLGAVDAELTYLSLSKELYTTAQAMAEFRRAEANLREILPGLIVDKAVIPDSLWVTTPTLLGHSIKGKAWVDNHPTVMASRFEWEVLRQQAELARRETKADPTFGIHAGKDDDEDYVGLTISIPLNVRNNFNAKARAAGQTALSAEANYLAIRRSQQFAIAAATDTLNEYQQRYEYWQALMEGRGERSEKLLEKQWRSGDLSTTKYLLTLQQRTAGLLAGIDLQSQFQLAHIDWLLQTGLITKALMQMTQQPIQDLQR